MQGLTRWIVAATLAASMTGCCSSLYRHWQDYIGWCDPRPDCFRDWPPAPRTTPPGPTMPAVMAGQAIEESTTEGSAEVGRPQAAQ